MAWADIKAQGRQVVHETFSQPARYIAPGATLETSVPCTVRLHSGDKVIGSDTRDGFAEVVEHITSLVFNTAEVTPSKRGVVALGVEGDGPQFILDFRRPDDGSAFVKWDVVKGDDA